MNDEPGRAHGARSFALKIGLRVVLGLVALSVLVAWRVSSLGGLPDIGDPFDVAGFADLQIPDDRNAFVLYKQAVAKLGKQPANGDGGFDWPKADEAKRRWLADSRVALDLWRRGTERPDALYIPPRRLTFSTMLPVVQSLRDITRLASLEGTRLEAEGDFAGAIGWYLAVLRSGKHCGRRGVTIQRLVGVAMQDYARDRIVKWMVNPRVDAPMLRRALAEVIAADSLASSRSEILKSDYLSFINSLDDPALVKPELAGELPKIYDLPGGRAVMEDLPRAFKREPERSRRVVRLAVAHWLAAADLPDARRPPRASSGATSTGQLRVRQDLLPELFVFDASAPASARALPPAELARWWDSTLYAKRFLAPFSSIDRSFAREASIRGGLIVSLALELHHRERGGDPANLGDLVGPYLDALPDGFDPDTPGGSLRPTPDAAGTGPAPPPRR